ncbi:MAG: hypothetical protein Harvfovirus43_7 [Harvfovirus sp.]|uniref:Lipid desaturase domain-containing protein n=1 Tax=Harvfovirus sp. TaxID=2487768 RepID=A0A3G5A308_9VIRU|nr:MAG: hypothetical protein Harvfovirus43_7 [Harvfovirus sp.]
MDDIILVAWVSALLFVCFPWVYHFGGKIKRAETAGYLKRFVFLIMVIRVIVLWVQTMITMESFLLYLPPSLYLADFIAGMVHLVGDVTDQGQFIKHHQMPTYMCDKTYLHHTYRSYFLVNILLLFFPYFSESNFWMTTFLFTVQANETHAWLHTRHDERPYFVKYLQKFGLLTTAESHRRHHRDEHSRYFCTLNGWANPLVNIFANILYTIKVHIEEGEG